MTSEAAGEPADLSLSEVLDLLHRRQLSAVELVLSCLARIDAAEPRIRAFVTVTPDRALDAARRADSERAAGRHVGPLAGVPVAVKDIFDVVGLRTHAGSRVVGARAAESDAAAWATLSLAGAGLIGKTTTHEFAYGTSSWPTGNPWNLARTPGGSSGGSAAAVAARMAPLALGSDTGGSLRIPAAACGVCTLRSAPGRISRRGVVPLSPTLDVVGLLARRMLDVAAAMNILVEQDGDRRYPAADAFDLAGIRIGVCRDWPGRDIDPELSRVCHGALDGLAERGAVIVDVRPPGDADTLVAEARQVFDTINSFEAYQVHLRWSGQRALYTRQVRDRVEFGALVDPEMYAAACHRRSLWQHRWGRFLRAKRLDAVAHPTLEAAPPLLDVAGRSPEPGIGPSIPWSLAGFAAASVPAGLDRHNLPVGISLAAPPDREVELVGLAVALDEMVELWRVPPPDPGT